MSAEEIKKDPVIKSIFDEGGLEHPSANFTDQIINTIKSESKDAVFVYKPIISKKAWLILIFIGLSLFVYLTFGLSSESSYFGIHGFSMNFDAPNLKEFMGRFKFSFGLSPILKTALIALSIFTFSNLIIFELKSKSLFR